MTLKKFKKILDKMFSDEGRFVVNFDIPDQKLYPETKNHTTFSVAGEDDTEVFAIQITKVI